MIFVMIKPDQIDVLDLRESVWVKVQARLLGKREKKGRVKAGLVLEV